MKRFKKQDINPPLSQSNRIFLAKFCKSHFHGFKLFPTQVLFVDFVNRVEDAGQTLRTFATVALVGFTATDPRPDTLKPYTLAEAVD